MPVNPTIEEVHAVATVARNALYTLLRFRLPPEMNDEASRELGLAADHLDNSVRVLSRQINDKGDA